MSEHLDSALEDTRELMRQHRNEQLMKHHGITLEQYEAEQLSMHHLFHDIDEASLLDYKHLPGQENICLIYDDFINAFHTVFIADTDEAIKAFKKDNAKYNSGQKQLKVFRVTGQCIIDCENK